MAITRVEPTNDDGTGTTGTALNKAFFDAKDDGIDAGLALLVNPLLDGANHTDTLAGSVARGDIIVGNSTPKWSRKAKGTAGYPFVGDGTDVAWSPLEPIGGGVGVATVTLADGATPALNAALGSVFRLAAAGDRTIAIPTNPTPGQKIVIQHFASGGARTLALNSGAGGFRFGSDIASLSQTASGKTDYIGCIYNDTDSKWDIVAVTKGF